MIVEQVNFYKFKAAFHRMNRGNEFSDRGLRIIYNHLLDLSEEIGEDINLDVIAICCDISQSAGVMKTSRVRLCTSMGNFNKKM